jgi:dipeptidyl aminopeptidase/acylaminoacyl peptidase
MDVIPKSFDARTRVHEYGGGAWTVCNGAVYFSNDADQRLYCLDNRGASPVPLTHEGAWRYADGIIDHRRRRWIGVREDHSISSDQPINTVVALNLDEAKLQSASVLLSGHDFYSSPRLSPDARHLVWLAWDHPNMPWTNTTLYLADFDEIGTLSKEPVVLAGGEGESVFQPEWALDGSALCFVSDRSGWWNLYYYRLATREVQALAPMPAEFGKAQWNLGMSTYAIVDDKRLICAYSCAGMGKLAVLELQSQRLYALETPYTAFSSVHAHGNRVVFRAGGPRVPSCIVSLDVGSGGMEVLQRSTDLLDDDATVRYFTQPQAIEFPTDENKTAFGLYYPPFNPDFIPPESDLPPLVVRCHGGPTSEASNTLDLRIHYWTSRGMAVLDINYGGSTGFGRAYRDRLHLKWGVTDIRDSVNGAKFLAQKGLADEHRCVITGSSAGGYTALAALTFTDYFKAGASYYGISDLTALARGTHKCESHYLDWLLGPSVERDVVARARSPLYHLNHLAKPIIFFHGDEDAVVPLSQTEEIVVSLRQKAIPVSFLLFSRERHGFRKGENIKRGLDAELYFFAEHAFRTCLRF